MKRQIIVCIVLAVSIIGTSAVLAYTNSVPNQTVAANKVAPSESALLLNGKLSTPTFNNNDVSNIKRSIPAVQRCQVIHWEPNHVYTITGSLNIGTHVIFPETGVDAVVGNKELWKVEHNLNHVFLKPTSTLPDGEISSLSFVGDSNTSYEFILKRVPDEQAKSCVVIERCGEMMNDTAWDNYQSKDKRMVSLLADQLQQEKKQIISQQQNALDKYRGMIYTRYSSCPSCGWFGKDYVSDVYDDGRWTYIRIQNDCKPIMAIYGELDCKKNLLQFTYDETTKIYRISGIYQKLILSYGNNSITIVRKPE